MNAAGVNGAGVWEADTGAKLVQVPSPIQLPLWRLQSRPRLGHQCPQLSSVGSACPSKHYSLGPRHSMLPSTLWSPEPTHNGESTMGSLRVMRCNAQPTIAHQAQCQVSLKTGHGGKDFTTVKFPAPGPSRQCPVHSDGDQRRCPAHSAWGTLGWTGPGDGVSSAQRLVLGCMWP